MLEGERVTEAFGLYPVAIGSPTVALKRAPLPAWKRILWQTGIHGEQGLRQRD